ncbi:MAG: SUMF1/EgtB/PvdO family nonheme iron enzyme [Prevotella sp.]|nr:SUMF1/EgtB/PvdO family nonheme iron enzyme [Prevotella sp.]
MEQTKYDVFISYSRKDYVDGHKNVIPGNEVSKIKEALTKAGITYWFDEEGVYSGDDFAKVIVKSIKASKIFVFLSTENSNLSEWTANEISTAHMLKKKIIPVRIDDSVYHDDVILYISRLSHIDYNDNPEKGRQDLIQSINSYLAEEKLAEAQKIAEEKQRQEELERQRRQQEEERKRQEKIAEIETDISALESQRTERKKAVLQKEQELKLAQVDLEECEVKIQKLQQKLAELREPQVAKEKAKQEEAKRIAEGKRKAEERRIAEEECKRREEEEQAKEKIFTVGGVSFKMIRVEGGSFLMGSPDNDSEAYGDEKPQHRLTLSDYYYIGEMQVTQSLWKAVMGNNPSKWKGDNLPVEQVSWNDCQEFIKQLNKKTGKTFHLPTEAEWEYAARGGNKSKGYKYAGSNDIKDVAWYGDNSGSNTHPVKGKKANELGLYDMSGTVWEWCQDWYGSYNSSAQTNPTGPSSGSFRVLRGGGWSSGARGCRVACRNYYGPDYRGSDIGFRLALVHQ